MITFLKRDSIDRYIHTYIHTYIHSPAYRDVCTIISRFASLRSNNAVFIHADPSATPQLLLPTESEVRITVGGDFNEWLNISSVVIQGAEDPDSKIFMCEVCTNQSAPLQQCYTSNFTLRVIGAPPVISNPPTSSKIN